jgi:hypothetical protein
MEIMQYSRTVDSVGTVLELIRDYHADILEIVLPEELLANRDGLIAWSPVPVIRAITRRSQTDAEGKVTFTFQRYVRIEEFTVRAVDL